jgi:hypothetical protein
LRAHLIDLCEDIHEDEEFDYRPAVGELDNTIAKSSVTMVTLQTFAYWRLPSIEGILRTAGSALRSQNEVLES